MGKDNKALEKFMYTLDLSLLFKSHIAKINMVGGMVLALCIKSLLHS